MLAYTAGIGNIVLIYILDVVRRGWAYYYVTAIYLVILFFIRNQVFIAIHKNVVLTITLLKVGSGRGLRCWLLREYIKGICCSVGGWNCFA